MLPDCVSEFGIANGILGICDGLHDARVAFRGDSYRPNNRNSGSDALLPIFINFGQIVSPDIGGATAVLSVYYYDLMIGQGDVDYAYRFRDRSIL